MSDHTRAAASPKIRSATPAMPEFCMTARVRLVTPTSLGCVVLLQASPRRRQAGRISSPSIREGRRGDAFVRRARGKPHVAAEEYRLRPSLPTDEAEYRRLLGRTRRRYLHANNKQDVGAEERDGWGPRIATLPRKYLDCVSRHVFVAGGYRVKLTTLSFLHTAMDTKETSRFVHTSTLS